MTLVAKTKAKIKQAVEQDPQLEWVQQAWLKESDDGVVTGFLPDNRRLREWLTNDEVPQSLGQLILFCYGVEELAKTEGRDHLVPAAVGNYGAGDPIQRYAPGFFRLMSEDLEYDGIDGISGLENIDGLHRGAWGFESKPVKELVTLAQTMVQFYPAGYQGLDREQTQRRFVSGDAAIFASGSWDAAGVYKGVEDADDPDRRFEVVIAPPPLPAADERWGDMLKYAPSEANFRAGVPLSINKQSKNFDWALDFLMFMSSQPVNEEFNKIAAWLPAIVGSETTENMRPFEPIVEGYPGNESFSPADTNKVRANISTQWTRDYNQVIIGELDYDEFSQKILEYLKGKHKGAYGYWYQERLTARDKTRSLDRTLSVEEFNQAVERDEKAAARFRSLFYQSIHEDEGVYLELMWQKLYPDQPYPSLD